VAHLWLWLEISLSTRNVSDECVFSFQDSAESFICPHTSLLQPSTPKTEKLFLNFSKNIFFASSDTRKSPLHLLKDKMGAKKSR
jgi:hypothetical protein